MKAILKAIYSAIPFKKNIFLLIRLLFKPREKIYRHLNFKDKFSVEIDKNHRFSIQHYGHLLENELFWGGLYGNAWEPFSLKYWTELCKDAHYIVDVGANAGIYSLIAKEINPSATVVAFEPVKRVYAMLVKNIQLNNYEIQCVEKALSNFNGYGIIYDDLSCEHTYSVTVNKNRRPNNPNMVEFKIPTVRLDTFIQEHQVKQIDLMKIDVETHEPEVLEGFGNYLKEFQPSIIIEILNEEIALQVKGMISGIPYLLFNINEERGARKVDSLTKSDSYNFLLCKKEVALKLGLIS